MNQLEGTYKVDEWWQLWIDGELKERYVNAIEVEGREEGYRVAHYDECAYEITTLSLDRDDLEPILESLERL